MDKLNGERSFKGGRNFSVFSCVTAIYTNTQRTQLKTVLISKVIIVIFHYKVINYPFSKQLFCHLK